VWNSRIAPFAADVLEYAIYTLSSRLVLTILVLPELCHACYDCSEICPTNSLPMADRPWLLRHYRLHSLDFVESKLDIGVEMEPR
jgi:ferredoxin